MTARVSTFLVTIAEKAPEWIVSVSVDGGVPFVESFTSKRDAGIGAKQNADGADPGDVFTVSLGEEKAEGLPAEGFVAWLREHW